ncbi:hypothetical protein F5X96DRAFT_472234 [Biscogniauxia mediterranea]|nr:hypothetical protein F5X96DRAFT_472234 [Biscogniauxia mediterranea]
MSRATPRRRCGCSCHSRGEYYQSHCRSIFVTEWFFLSYDRKVPASSPTECRKCTCSGQHSSTELLIQLPSWLCKSAMLGIFSSGPKSGISMSLRPTVIIDSYHYIWYYIPEGNVVRFNKEISAAHFSLEDIGLQGESLFESLH